MFILNHKLCQQFKYTHYQHMSPRQFSSVYERNRLKKKNLVLQDNFLGLMLIVRWPIEFTWEMSGMRVWSTRRIEFTWEMSGVHVWSSWRERLNNWVPSWFLMPKYAIHNKLAALQLEHVNCRMFPSTYMQRIFCKLEGVQNLNRMVNVSTKTIFTRTSKQNWLFLN